MKSFSTTVAVVIVVVAATVHQQCCSAFVPLLDGGKDMPALYNGWFNDQIVKQATTAVSKAVGAGKKKIEVNFPPVPNVDEVKFGTPLNQKFGKTIVARNLGIKGGYRPGSNISRNLIGFSNIYWAKQLAGSIKGGGMMGGGKSVAALSAEPVAFSECKNLGDITRLGQPMTQRSRQEGRNQECIICINPGGEETWDRLLSAHGSPGSPFVILNNAYSTTYDLGNKRNYEEAYYLKRISKGWVYRSYPGPWKAYLERPDGKVELMKTYNTKPPLREVATLVREESFKRFAINNDRWTPGFGERL